jgi:hypothetical protein
MGGIILLVGFELAGSIRHYFPVLHKNTSQPLSGCVAIYDKIPLNVWQGQHWGCGQSSLQLLELLSHDLVQLNFFSFLSNSVMGRAILENPSMNLR